MIYLVNEAWKVEVAAGGLSERVHGCPGLAPKEIYAYHGDIM